MRWSALLLLMTLFPGFLFAHEIQSLTQHLNLRRQNQSAWQQDVLAKVNLNEKFDVGAQVTYLERFDLFENRAGGLIAFRPSEVWSFEARYLVGNGNDILPEKDLMLMAYHSTGVGISPFFYYKDSQYSATRLHSFNLGVEIEKISGIILIPSVTVGSATFKSPAETKTIHNYGLRATYYQEKIFSFSLFAYSGKEASQGIIGSSNILVDTLSGGAAFSWYFTDNFKSELTFDHTDYDQLNNEFHTTTLNLIWTL